MKKKQGSTYSREKLYSNIRSALSCDGTFIEDFDIKEPIINQWKNSKYKVFHYRHWYYAVKLAQNQTGDMIAITQDALYEGDYHNDSMTTTPYESLLRSNCLLVAEYQSGNLFQQCAREVLSEERRKIGEYEVIEGSGIMGTCRAPSIKQFGWFAELCMYYSKAHAYCLHLRKKTDKGFFCEIVPAPELGENETKYVPRHLSEIPVAIRQDALQMILVQKMWRNRLSKQKR